MWGGSFQKMHWKFERKEFNRWAKADSKSKYFLNSEALVKCMDQVFNPSITYSTHIAVCSENMTFGPSSGMLLEQIFYE